MFGNTGFIKHLQQVKKTLKTVGHFDPQTVFICLS